MTTEQGPRRVLALSGPLNIVSADATRRALLWALQEQPELALDCGQAKEFDTAFVQLLLAARRTAEARGGRLTVLRPMPKAFAEVLDAGGFGAALEIGGAA